MEVIIGNEKIKIIFVQKKIKRTYLRITNKKEILISSPRKLSNNDINKVINDNYQWLVNRISKVNIINIEKDEFLLFGKMYKVQITVNKDISINNNIIRIDNISKIEEYAFSIIKERFQEIIREIKFAFIPELRFRKMRSRWGVCHYKDQKIVLNKVLIHLPWELIEYVIYHELAHFKIPNHSKSFYQELFRLCPQHKILKSQLLEYGSLL